MPLQTHFTFHHTTSVVHGPDCTALLPEYLPRKS